MLFQQEVMSISEKHECAGKEGFSSKSKQHRQNGTQQSSWYETMKMEKACNAFSKNYTEQHIAVKSDTVSKLHYVNNTVFLRFKPQPLLRVIVK